MIARWDLARFWLAALLCAGCAYTPTAPAVTTPPPAAAVSVAPHDAVHDALAPATVVDCTACHKNGVPVRLPPPPPVVVVEPPPVVPPPAPAPSEPPPPVVVVVPPVDPPPPVIVEPPPPVVVPVPPPVIVPPVVPPEPPPPVIVPPPVVVPPVVPPPPPVIVAPTDCRPAVERVTLEHDGYTAFLRFWLKPGFTDVVVSLVAFGDGVPVASMTFTATYAAQYLLVTDLPTTKAWRLDGRCGTGDRANAAGIVFITLDNIR